jgi:hypothetical protein
MSPLLLSARNFSLLSDISVFSSFPYKCLEITLHWTKTL